MPASLNLTSPFKRFRAALLAACMIAVFSAFAGAQEDTDEAADAVALFNQGQDAHEKGDLAAALALYEKALAVIPEFPEAQLQRGVVLLATGRPKDAEAAYRRALELRPDWTLALAGLGSVLVSNEKFAEAEPLLAKAIALDAQNYPAYVALADLRLRTRADKPALQALLSRISAVAARPKAPAPLWSAKAALEHELGIATAAGMSAARALEIDPANVAALVVRLDLALAERDAVRADEIVARLSRIESQAAMLPVYRARVLLARDKPVEAATLLASIKEQSPAVVELREQIAAASRPYAIAELEAALAKNARDVMALSRLCSALRTSDPVKALEYCRRASEAEPQNVAHAVGYGAALVQAKDHRSAAALFRKLLQYAPENATARANLATALYQLKDYAAAKEQYQWLTFNQPSSPAAHFFLAVTHDHLGEYLDAMANYQQFLRLADPEKFGTEIERVKLRIPALNKDIKGMKGRKVDAKR